MWERNANGRRNCARGRVGGSLHAGSGDVGSRSAPVASSMEAAIAGSGARAKLGTAMPSPGVIKCPAPVPSHRWSEVVSAAASNMRGGAPCAEAGVHEKRAAGSSGCRSAARTRETRTGGHKRCADEVSDCCLVTRAAQYRSGHADAQRICHCQRHQVAYLRRRPATTSPLARVRRAIRLTPESSASGGGDARGER